MRKIISYVSLFSMMNRNSMLGLGSAVRAFLLPCQFALQSLDIAVCFAHVLFLAMGEIIGLFASTNGDRHASVNTHGVLFQIFSGRPLQKS
ncbi:hypothetical protein ABH37_20165 [Mycobacterium haemophilum]|jgi:hypothetical protein|nr:hypothetical protein ABH37_20165 [Mycobacterium haemophilum]KLO42348.1 hypothetical protein ABH36_20175 [Mycobacterium haemophilum]